jgi:hypothetical protein
VPGNEKPRLDPAALHEARALVRDGLREAGISASNAARSLGYRESTICGWLGVRTPPRTQELGEGAALRLACLLNDRGMPRDRAERFLELLGYESMLAFLPPVDSKANAWLAPGVGDNPAAPLSTTVPAMLERAQKHAERGDRGRAIATMLDARDSIVRGSRAWADLTLDIALQCQQANEIEAAETYIKETESEYLDGLFVPDMEMQAKVGNRRGWILEGQIGDFEEAEKQFNVSRALSSQAGNDDLGMANLDFLVKVRAKQGMALGRAYMGAYPLKPQNIPQTTRRAIEESLTEDLPGILSRDPNNPAHYRHEFMARSLLSRSEMISAQIRMQKLEGMFREIGGEHLRLLCLARAHVSNGAFDIARGEAQSAFLRYSLQHYAHGMAHSGAVWAYALQQLRSSGEHDWRENYDLWILVLLLHPYPMHPLSQEAQMNLRELDKSLRKKNPKWVEGYLRGLDDRITARAGLFEHLTGVVGVQTRIPIRPYIVSLVSPPVMETGHRGVGPRRG